MMLNADAEGVVQMRTPADRDGGKKGGLFLQTSFTDDPLYIYYLWTSFMCKT